MPVAATPTKGKGKLFLWLDISDDGTMADLFRKRHSISFSNLFINTTVTQLHKHFSHTGKCLVRLHKSQNEILNQPSAPHESNLNILSPPLVIFRHVAVSIPFPSGAPLVWSVTNVHHSPLTLHTHCRMEGCREEIERFKAVTFTLNFSSLVVRTWDPPIIHPFKA